jgi:hypothetical protein
VDTAHRQLVDAAGRPYLLRGDAVWSLVAQLSEADARVYFEARRASGFNTVLVNLIEHEFATNAPANRAGTAPFRSSGTLAAPNDAYFDHAERIVALAQRFGFLVLLTPAYTGYGGAEQGWYQEMKATGTGALLSYGRYVGRRFARYNNIVWVNGGDFDPPDHSLVGAVARGIAEADPTALQTFNGARGSTVRDDWGTERWFKVDNIYTDQFPLEAARDAHAQSRRPFFLIEGYYENEHGTTQVDLRRQGYETILAGGAGQVFGNNPMWHFDAPGLFEVPTTWQQELHSKGTNSDSHLASFFTSLPWWNLRPDQGQFLTDPGTSEDPAVAAVSCDRSLAVVYVPSRRPVTVDLLRLARGTTLTWRDPASGRQVPVPAADLASTEARVTVTPPGRNADGDGDWLLVARTG